MGGGHRTRRYPGRRGGEREDALLPGRRPPGPRHPGPPRDDVGNGQAAARRRRRAGGRSPRRPRPDRAPPACRPGADARPDGAGAKAEHAPVRIEALVPAVQGDDGPDLAGRAVDLDLLLRGALTDGLLRMAARGPVPGAHLTLANPAEARLRARTRSAARFRFGPPSARHRSTAQPRSSAAACQEPQCRARRVPASPRTARHGPDHVVPRQQPSLSGEGRDLVGPPPDRGRRIRRTMAFVASRTPVPSTAAPHALGTRRRPQT